ncbi:MAG: 50S ribosomal protein L30 [Candidatus ainarchaeum sp.]|nr:50S ribosomal protein L30 [Candidatus ainarchaeum sp.]
MTEKIAIIRIRGIRNMKPKIKKTLELLNLTKPNQCVVVNSTAQMLGMINVVRDYVAYGKISQDIIKKLITKRGEKEGKMIKSIHNEKDIEKISEELAKGEHTKKYMNPVFRLHPPRKGYKDIKRAYPYGDLGERADIEKLIVRMM